MAERARLLEIWFCSTLSQIHLLTLTLVNPLEYNSWKLSHNQMLKEVDIVVIFLYFEYACVLSCFGCVRLFATLWTIARQTPLSVGISRQEYWVSFHALLQGIFLTQESNPRLLLFLRCQVGF